MQLYNTKLSMTTLLHRTLINCLSCFQEAFKERGMAKTVDKYMDTQCIGLDKFCRQNFEQNKRFLRRASILPAE